MRYILIFTGLILFGVGCCEKSHDLANYKKQLKEAPSYLVDFFPKETSKPYKMERNLDTTSLCIFYFYFDLNANMSPNLKKKIDGHVAKYISSDTNLVLVEREPGMWRDKYKFIKKKKSQNIVSNNKFYYPVPFFETDEHLSDIGIKKEDVYSKDTPSGLSEDFIIYVLESKSGNYWEGLKPLYYMPEGWKNGYSKGISINSKKNIVIYWFVVW